MNKLFCLITLLLLAANVQAQEYYRSIDSSGKVHYGDAPAKNAVESEKLKSRAEPNGNDALPFETRRANAKFPVTLYVADNCEDGCPQARDYLNKRGIPFTEKKLVSQEEIEAFKKESGGDHVPGMHIGSSWLFLFSESRWSQALDAAGYPKSLPQGSRPAVKSVPSTTKPKSE